MPTSRAVRIGREPDNDLVVDVPTVSGYHARAWPGDAPGQAVVEDLGSSNGTSVGTPGHRVKRATIVASDTLYLGTYPLPAARVFEALGAAGGRSATAVLPVAAGPVIVGRDPSCTRQVDDPVVSGRHARLTPQADGTVLVEDLGSLNGTTVNGRPVSGPTPARAGDTVGLGGRTLVLSVGPPTDAGPAGTVVMLLDPEVGEGRGGVDAGAWWLVLGLPVGLLAGVLAAATSGFRPALLADAAGWPVGVQAVAGVLSRLAWGAVVVGLVAGAAAALLRGLGPGLRWGGGAASGAAGCLAAWGAAAALTGVGATGPGALALLGLACAAGFAAGAAAAFLLERPASVAVAVAVLAVVAGAFGGDAAAWRVSPGWARTGAGLNPSRWAFEGLLLLESGRRSPPAGVEGDLAEPDFPAETERMGPGAVVLALNALLVGWGVAAVYFAAGSDGSEARSRASRSQVAG